MPLPEKLLMEPPVAVTSSTVKSVEASDKVKVMVAEALIRQSTDLASLFQPSDLKPTVRRPTSCWTAAPRLGSALEVRACEPTWRAVNDASKSSSKYRDGGAA